MRTAMTFEDRRGGQAADPAPTSSPEPAATDDQSGGDRARFARFALRNWRVRTRLVALVLIPTLAATVLGGVRMLGAASTAGEYGRAGDIATFVTRLTELTHKLQLERDLSALFIAEGRREPTLPRLEAQWAEVDEIVARVVGTIGSIEAIGADLGEGGARLRDEVRAVRGRLQELARMREAVVGTELPALSAIDMYSRALTDLLAVHDEIGQGLADDEALNNGVGAFAALARAKEQASQERAILSVALNARDLRGETFDAFVAARAQRDSELAAFRLFATLAQRQAFDDQVTGAKVDRAELIRLRALLAATGRIVPGTETVLTPAQSTRWFESASDTIDRIRTVEESLANGVAARSRQLQESESGNAVLIGFIVAVLLLAVLALTVVMARSLVRPLRRLRAEALYIAGERLPETVRSLRDAGEEAPPTEVAPIGVASSDEVGEVARAFDEVHREAVRLAGEEARLRSNVNAMFVNLSRRTQTLVERQIRLIDGLEQGERDETRLANLFKLDHLATRMRRNSENLLVLAGQEPPRRWSKPVQLMDVVRAALSEVENYDRVNLNVSSGIAVAGQAVNDVIHLLAELVENAIAFSPRETRVTVSGDRIDGGGVMIAITDAGIGMTAEELTQANWRLNNPPVVDVSVSRRMGLWVVARLARRHGIRVQLRPHESGGLTAMVLLPEALTGNRNQPTLFGATGPQPYGTGPETAGLLGAGAASAGLGGMAPPRQSLGRTDWPDALPLPPGPAGAPAYVGNGHAPADPFAGPAHPDALASGPLPDGFGRRPFGSLGPASDARPRPGYDLPAPRPQQSPALPQQRGATEEPGPLDADFATGPLPAIRPSPLESGDDFLPIFAAVESAWFDREEGEWGASAADAGWSAAEVVRDPVRDGATAAGLPKRVPKANLVPGSAEAGGGPKVAPLPELSPERARSRLSSFQKGVRAARSEISEGRVSPVRGMNFDVNEEDA
jgi:signal transduction histidine kinase